MSLNRLCFIAGETHHQPPSHKHRRLRRLRISALLRRSLHWFCRRRWHALCRCFPDDPTGGDDDAGFEDIDGVSSDDSHANAGGGPRIFSFAELYIGTRGFNDGELLGRGGFGSVYRAVLPSDNTLVAVKRVAGPGERFAKAIAAELVAVAHLRHRNLVRLRGWCVHDHQLLLVYDYMPNGSLDRLIFPSAASAAAALGWGRRWRIVTGLAASLFYLHDQLDTQIIHRDVKASNVMLDAGFNARLGDFGLARWLEHGDPEPSPASKHHLEHSHFRLTDTSRIGGTIGYLPPESFQRRGGATAKHDVFSFGIVVLEVATGRRAVDLAYPDDEIFMLDWVRRLSDAGELSMAGDRRLLDGSHPLAEMERLLRLGLHCTLHDPNSRPTMKWVMEVLTGSGGGDGDGELPALPSFHAHPLYITISPTTTNTTATTTTATFVTAVGTTQFFTADDGAAVTDSTATGRRYPASLPCIDTPREIPYSEILAITDNFAASHQVAELDFGTGYRGNLGRAHVLVKRLGMKTCPALRVRFSDELRNLGRLRHRHLVQLRGWCTEHGEMLVVYDHSLSSRLLSHRLFHHRVASAAPLSWRHRYNIVRSLASAVLYLHEEWEEQVIHRNITSSAVFLDADMSPRLGSFALAEFLSRNEHGHCSPNSTTSSPRGIFGYIAPEYMESGNATKMADVYSFGVVVLEVLSGLMAVDFRRPEALLVRRVRTLRRPAEEFVDARLDGKYDKREMMRLVSLGMACTRSEPEARPSMKQIVSILDGNDGLLEIPGNKKGGVREVWEERNADALSLVRRIQALGIN